MRFPGIKIGKKKPEALGVLPRHVLGRVRESLSPHNKFSEFDKKICEEILQDQDLSIEEIYLIISKVQEIKNKIVKTTPTEELLMDPENPTTMQFYIGLCITAAALLGVTSLCIAGLYAKKRLSRPLRGKSKTEMPPPNVVSIKIPQNPRWIEVRNFIMSQPDCRYSAKEDVLYLSPDVVRKLQGYGLWTTSLIEDISRQSNGTLKEIMPQIGDRFDLETMEEDVGLTGEREVVAVNWPGLRDTRDNSVISKAFVSVRQI